MFKLKVSEKEHKVIKERLDLVETVVYDYVLTDDKEKCEDDKLNIVFNKADIPRLIRTLDLIVKGEDKNIVGFNEFGQKSVESRNFHYFIVDGDAVYGVLSKTKLIIKLKLYEIEEYLQGKDFIGVGAGKNTTDGGYNNFFGYLAGCCNTTGAYNNFFGFSPYPFIKPSKNILPSVACPS